MTTAQLSQVAKVGIGSPTTQVAVIHNTTGSVTTTYTAAGPVAIKIVGTNTQSGGSLITYNGAGIYTSQSTTSPPQVFVNFETSLASGQTATIVSTNVVDAVISVRRID